MDEFGLAVNALLGTIVGSFLNVVIWRLPRGENLSRPGSHCPGCGKPIAWFDNVPVLSWVLLRARCRSCRSRISGRYPFVEAFTGGLFALVWLRWPGEIGTVAVADLALAALVAISFIDWDHKIIPDRITKPGILLAVLAAPATVLHPPDWLAGVKPGLNAWLHAGAGALAGALVILAIRWLGYLVLRKEAMGLGDVKLLALIGALVGPLQVLYALMLACFAGALIGGARLLWARRRPLDLAVEVRGGDLSERFERARIEGTDLLLQTEREAEAGKAVKVRLVLPAAGILEDTDARVEAAGRLAGVEGHGGARRWRVRLEGLSAEDVDRLAFYAGSYRYVPFGPFLALGGAATLLYGDFVHWLFVEGYPTLVRGWMS
jgi:leader peptidase (prepilin peptidase)/N-methyltransferase